MPYIPVSHTLSISPTAGADGFDFSGGLPTTNTAFVTPAFTFGENPIGPYTPKNFLLSRFPSGGLYDTAAEAFHTSRPSSGQLYPR